MRLWIATAVDCGDSCNGKARVIGAFKIHDEAKNCVNDDIGQRIGERAGLNLLNTI